MSGVVLAAFDRSAYLDLAGRVVAVASGSRARGPLAIVVDDFPALQPIAIGEPVGVAEGVLRVGRGAVLLEHAPLWDPALPALTHPPASHASAIRAVLAMLQQHAPAESLAPLLKSRSDRVAPRHSQILAACRRSLDAIAGALAGARDPDRLSEAIAGVAGLGPGLTPSGDDLLMGILHAVTAWPDLVARANWPTLRHVIIDIARPRTTRISAAYLEAAAWGLATEPWHGVVRALARWPGQAADTSPDRDPLRAPAASLRDAVLDLLRMGETSGADGLTGFCWAWEQSGAPHAPISPTRRGRD